ncbi:MAG: ChaN family lipoprotein [Pseudomonadota bacterium]
MPRPSQALMCLAVAALLGGCAGQPEAPVLRPLSDSAAAATAARLDSLLPTDVLLLGEQHDAAEHQQIEQQVIALLAARSQLAAVALEMADAGVSTAKLHPSSTEQQVQSALKWNNKGWPWQAYGPAVMTAVRAGVPVLGANLPRAQMQASMEDSKLDMQLPGPALKAQQQSIRIGHCNLLPENQITPMTRTQIARDISMATTLGQAMLPGKVVVLLAGSGHADRTLGVPQHLPQKIQSKAVLMQAERAQPATEKIANFDATWVTTAVPEVDYCAKFKAQSGQ